ncbi:MAG: hypothetical protein IKN87_04365 [Bacilli bacterium]|nr:hypothetical protein [Bacilli bacterium]
MLELLKLSRGVTYTCGSGELKFDGLIPTVTSTIVLIIQIGVPVLLIIFGMFDLGKAVIAQKEDEIKKGQSTFFKRLIAAILVFFVVTIVKLVVGFAADRTDAVTCIDCFIKGNADSCQLSNNGAPSTVIGR